MGLKEIESTNDALVRVLTKALDAVDPKWKEASPERQEKIWSHVVSQAKKVMCKNGWTESSFNSHINIAKFSILYVGTGKLKME
jgi:hypothetical protein